MLSSEVFVESSHGKQAVPRRPLDQLRNRGLELLGTRAEFTTMTKRAPMKVALLLMLLHLFTETSEGAHSDYQRATALEDEPEYQTCIASPSTCTVLCVPKRDDPTMEESCTC